MNRKSTVFSALLVLAALTASPGFAACTAPPPFSKLPDGTRASREEMMAANAQVKQYVTDLNTYISCVDQEAPLAQDPKDLDAAQKKEQDAREVIRVQRHNAAVADQESLRDRWHDVLEAYKKKHPS